MADEFNRIYIRFNGRVLGPINHEKAVDLVRRGQAGCSLSVNQDEFDSWH